MKLFLGAAAGRGSNASLFAIEAGMRVYLGMTAGMRSNLGPTLMQPRARPMRFLFSYYYFRDVDIDAALRESFGEQPVELFADSGAFSAFTQGRPIDKGAYVEWIERWRHRFAAAAGPDVIGDAVATLKETRRMRDRVKGLPVLPTFHVGERWRDLEACLEMSDYIAFGGMVPHIKSKNVIVPWLRSAFDRVPEHVRVHGFGLTAFRMLRDFPWYSVDSSPWTSGVRFATLGLFDDRRGELVQVLTHSPASLLEHRDLIARYGLRVTQLRASDFDKDLLSGVSVESWQRAEAWLDGRSKWAK